MTVYHNLARLEICAEMKFEERSGRQLEGFRRFSKMAGMIPGQLWENGEEAPSIYIMFIKYPYFVHTLPLHPAIICQARAEKALRQTQAERKLIRMYMINYKNTYRRKAPLTQRIATFVNNLIKGAE